jgi:transposase-like protein
MRKKYTAAQRAALIDLVTTGQATPLAAAAKLGVSESTAYYWLKCAGRRSRALARVAEAPRPSSPRRAQLTAGPMFARLVRTPVAASMITLRVGGVTIEVSSGFDPALLRGVVAALVEPTS